MHNRLPDWHQRLLAFVTECAATPYEDGVHDCALFFAGGVAAMTGVDYAGPYRGRYTTIRGGLRILRWDGFADHVALAAHHLAARPVAFLQVGDGAVVETPQGPALGIVQGPLIYHIMPGGIGTVPLMQAHKGFAV